MKKEIIQTRIICHKCECGKGKLYKTTRVRYLVCNACNSMISIMPRKEHFFRSFFVRLHQEKKLHANKLTKIVSGDDKGAIQKNESGETKE